MENIIKTLYKNNYINRSQLVYLLNNLNEFWEKRLFDYAQKTLEKTYGNRVFLRGLLEFSNYCQNDCKYCGLQKDNIKVNRYRLSNNQILDCFAQAYRLGYKTLVLQSGEDSFYTDRKLCSLIKVIKKKFPDVAVTLSIGERSYKSYKTLFEAGADRYLLRHETVNEELYNKFHPQMDYKHRQQSLEDLINIGYQTGSGFIIGLPGQTVETIADNLLFLKYYDLDMVGLGPLIPHPSTPLSECNVGSVRLTLICYALTRLLLPEALIPATTALNTLDNKGWEKGLEAGANVVMPNLSPEFVREKYEIYKDKGDTDVSDLAQIRKRVHEIGFEIDMERGDSLKWLRRQKNKGV